MHFSLPAPALCSFIYSIYFFFLPKHNTVLSNTQHLNNGRITLEGKHSFNDDKLIWVSLGCLSWQKRVGSLQDRVTEELAAVELQHHLHCPFCLQLSFYYHRLASNAFLFWPLTTNWSMVSCSFCSLLEKSQKTRVFIVGIEFNTKQPCLGNIP